MNLNKTNREGWRKENRPDAVKRVKVGADCTPSQKTDWNLLSVRNFSTSSAMRAWLAASGKR
jgi:hypothetical protein